ncbi:MAG: transglycosylase SLT domain-containing protein, partial [Alphaproteobacteria bacterium]|nr:transglycosylase SLT domain-containing protein [Alphaproteobacteria bacterium]
MDAENHFWNWAMRIIYLYTLVILLWPTAANATVIEYNGDGSVTMHKARDYLADHRHLQMAPIVTKASSLQMRRDRFHKAINSAASRYDIDPDLLHAIIETESAYRPESVSNKGAQGLMQLMPRTAEAFGVKNAFDPEENIQGGTRYLR